MGGNQLSARQRETDLPSPGKHEIAPARHYLINVARPPARGPAPAGTGILKPVKLLLITRFAPPVTWRFRPVITVQGTDWFDFFVPLTLRMALGLTPHIGLHVDRRH